MLNTSPKSSVSSCAPNSSHSDEVDDIDVAADVAAEHSSSPSIADCRLDEHPLNLTKRKQKSPFTGTSTIKAGSSPDGPPCRSRQSSRRCSTSFSLKTSPSTFVCPATDNRRRLRSKTSPKSVDGWSSVHYAEAFDNSPSSSVLLTTSPSALDRVLPVTLNYYIV